MVILMWTAVDLANASACSLDNEALPGTAHSFLIGAAALGADGSVTPVHIDDCFCCSHCVKVQAIVIPDAVPRATASYQPPPQRSPLVFASVFYHPPDSLR